MKAKEIVKKVKKLIVDTVEVASGKTPSKKERMAKQKGFAK